MKRLLWGLLIGGLTLPTFAADWGLVQETSAGLQKQTVQAIGYEGGEQVSEAFSWTLGLDWDRTVSLRGGFQVRSVLTSPVFKNTVYPGYQGWGWVVAADWMPFRWTGTDAAWAVGATAAGTYESFEYPGLYKSFVLPGLSLALTGEVVPATFRGLALRLRVPVGLDQRPGFSLAWRVGAELSVVFRGVGGQTP